MAETSIKISLTLANEAANKALSDFINRGDKAEKSLDGLKKTGSSTFDQISLSIGKSIDTFDIFSGNLAANLVTKALDSIVSVIHSLTETFHEMIKEASESEAAINNLNIALKNAGLYSQDTSLKFQKYAEEIQRVTVYSDDAVLASSSLLLSLTNLSVDGIQEATSAAVDLAATLNIDLQSATEMIAKAVNGNVKSFKLLGINIDSGKTSAERLTNVLDALATQHGAGEAKTKTYTGSQAQLTNAQNDLLKVMGKLLTENTAVINSLNSLAEAFIATAEWVQQNHKFLGDLTTTIGITTAALTAGAAAWFLYSAAAGSALVTNIALAAAIEGVSVANVIVTATASAAWAAITGPVGLAVIGLTLVVTAIYQAVKNWDLLKSAAYNAMAATLEYSAVALDVFSEEKANSLRNQAAAWREQAVAIKVASAATADSSKQDEEQRRQREEKLSKELADIARVNAQKAALAKQLTDSLTVEEASRDQALAEIQSAHEQQQLEIHDQFQAAALQSRLDQQAADLFVRQEIEQQELQIVVDAELAKAKAIADAEQRKLAVKAANDKATLDRAKLLSKQEIETAKQSADAQIEIDKKRVSDRADTFATIATLSRSNNLTLATIGKAAAITQIAIETPVAIAKALAAFPPPINFVAAGVVGVAMAAQAANIAGVNFADGGIVPGSSFSGDRIKANVNSSEMILNREQQAQLFAMANGQGGGSSIDYQQMAIAFMAAIKEQAIIVNVGGKTIVDTLRGEIASGRSFA